LTVVGVLLTAAIYTRQSYALAAPFAVFVWLLARDWKRAFYFATLVGGLTLALFFILNGSTHGGFYFNIVTANINEFKMEQLTYHWDRFRRATFLLLIFGAASLFLIRRWNPLWTLSAPYLVGAALSALTIGKIGSNVNYLLELCAALSLAAGAVIAWSRVHLSVHSLRAALLIALALGVGKMTQTMLRDYAGDLRERRLAAKDLGQLEAFVTKTTGLILADEYMGMLTLQGRPLMIQPFEVAQLARAGKWDQSPLLESINKKEYASIILYDRPWSLSDRWTPEMLNAINHSYVLVDVIADNKVYKAFQRTASANLMSCPGALWRFPSDGSRGVQTQDNGIDFFGQGSERKIPVYAVADGFLMRRSDWLDAVAIQHDDPLHPGEKIWSYYSDMAAANGTDSYVVQDFHLGSSNVSVKAGQLLGYQGSGSGTPYWPMWVHVHFAVIRPIEGESFPNELTSENQLNPAQYLNLTLQRENKNLQTLECGQP
jgi:hypothetical protein